MIDYMYEGGVYYREDDNLLDRYEKRVKYSRYKDGKFIDTNTLIVTNGSIYELINHWNRVNRIQGSNWYYEAEP